MSDAANTSSAAAGCPYCGAHTRDDLINMTLWEGDRLFAIEGVPARVCEGCYEQFFDEAITFKIDYLRGLRFPLSKSERVLEVPVFSFEAIVTHGDS